MSELNLSALTIIELRKLAKELHVPLSAGISKQGIIERLTQAISKGATSVQEAAKPAEPETPAAPVQEAEAVKPAPVQPAAETVTPAPGFRQAAPAPRFNTKPAYQAPAISSRPAAPRVPSAEPQRTQTTRPVGFTPRFGPAAQEPSAPIREEDRPIRTEPQRSAYQPERRPAYGDNNRFQQRPAFEQRPAYESRPAFEQRPAYEASNRPTYEQPARPAYEQRPAAPASSEMLTPAECLDGSGVLELHPDGYGFLRSENLLPSARDIYVSAAQVRRFALRAGDRIGGKVRPMRDGDKYSAMLYLNTVNGVAAEGPVSRPVFEDMTAIYPTRRIRLEARDGETQEDMRLLDLVTPIGFGQRALIHCPPRTGKRKLLRQLANTISANYPDAIVLMLLFSETPEDVTLMRDQVSCPVLATTFDMPPENHLRLADLTVEYAQRIAESKRDVVLLVDSLTTLSKVFTTAAMQQGRFAPGSVSPTSLQKAKRIFGAARCLREGGSLTVIAAMNNDGVSKVDEAIISEFRTAANLELVLSSQLARAGVYPPVDLRMSRTRRVEAIMTPGQSEGLKTIHSLLGELPRVEDAVPELLKLMSKTSSNEDLLARIKDWAAAMRS